MIRKFSFGTQPKADDTFKIPPAVFPDPHKLLEKLLAIQETIVAQPQDRSEAAPPAIPENLIRSLAVIATNVWRAKTEMMDGFSGEVREEMKLVNRHIEGILESFQEVGLEIIVYTGELFDPGLPLTVVSTQPMPGITQAQIIETIKPTIHWQNQIIQIGEVVVGIPAPAGEPPLMLENVEPEATLPEN